VFETLRVEPGTPARIADRDPRDTLGLGKSLAHELRRNLIERLDTLQRRLYAEGARSLLLVLQGQDASGKDGVIRSVFAGVSPQGCRVVPFRAPTGSELAHDYLWRVHAQLPARGEIGIFNRSHYEDVVAVRVRALAPKEVWSRRTGHIREWERMLADEGTALVKVFLHVSKEEQRKRLQERIDDPEKRWKFRLEDLEARERFDDYVAAYEDALTETSTEWAPWHVVPADRNWLKGLVVAQLLVDALERMDPQLPEPEAGIEGLKVV
jgi:PPK2 family polyphosphate:nucleotide phosphotransferase